MSVGYHGNQSLERSLGADSQRQASNSSCVVNVEQERGQVGSVDGRVESTGSHS